MSDTNTGGPAFPTPAHNLQNDGMTLRDYFAAKAMLIFFQGPDDANDYLHSPEDIANWCYIMADAMLKARQ
jgi:hypothetical protein